MNNYKRITKCRVCFNKNLVKIGSLGKIAVSNFTKEPQPGVKLPLELVFCENCSLLQLAHNFNRDILYRNYWYVSGLNPVIINDLKEIAKYGTGIHIDIGANDGTLLKYSKAWYRIAVDPSNIKPENANKWIQDYWENFDMPSLQADTITAIACLYDLPDPNKFMRQVQQYLRHDGTFIAQLMTLQPMIDNNDVGNICHEHLEYYSYKSLVRLFEQNGLEIYKVEQNNMNGGSYRLFARHFRKGSIKFEEKEYDKDALKMFMQRVEYNRDIFHWFLEETQPMLYGYGASTKANTILQYYGIKYINIIDINPDKIGKYPITGKLPIIDKIPDDCYYLWVFPYGFTEYFKKKEKNYKGRWVTTIPEFKIS